MLHVVKVVPIKMRGHSDLSGCDTLKVIGYRFTCSCEARGPIRGTMQKARLDLIQHRLDLDVP